MLKILKVLEPYDDNMKVLTKKELGLDGSLGSLGVDPAQVGLHTPVHEGTYVDRSDCFLHVISCDHVTSVTSSDSDQQIFNSLTSVTANDTETFTLVQRNKRTHEGTESSSVLRAVHGGLCTEGCVRRSVHGGACTPLRAQRRVWCECTPLPTDTRGSRCSGSGFISCQESVEAAEAVLMTSDPDAPFSVTQDVNPPVMFGS